MKRKRRKRRKSQGILGIVTTTQSTKKDAMNSTIETAKDLVIGVVAGGAIGSASGRISIPMGLIVTALGHYYDKRILSTLGLGIMAGSTFSKMSKDQGLEGITDNVKLRLEAFAEDLKHKFFLDQIAKKKPEVSEESSEAVGEVNTYSANRLEDAKHDEELKAIEAFFSSSAEQMLDNETTSEAEPISIQTAGFDDDDDFIEIEFDDNIEF